MGMALLYVQIHPILSLKNIFNVIKHICKIKYKVFAQLSPLKQYSIDYMFYKKINLYKILETNKNSNEL